MKNQPRNGMRCWDGLTKTLLLLLSTMVTSALCGQSTLSRATISILDGDKQPIIGAYVEILEVKQSAVTDPQGAATFLLPASRDYTVRVHSLGFEGKDQTFTLPQTTDFALKVDLSQTSTQLDEVLVTGASQSLETRKLPYKAQVVNLEALRSQPTEVSTILNQLSGVRVRQQGGAGSEANVMLNGIDGKGVRLFVDGLPVYLLGPAYSINALSSSIIDRIEVYKGTIPVAFGTDALGGIINVVTRYESAEFLDLSYTVGSWNTHQASFNARKKIGKSEKFFVSMDGAYNYSDNNYWMDDVDVVVDDLFNTEKGRARRFNDQFESFLGKAQFGVRNLSWADELVFLGSFSYVDREWQHGLRAEQPWGEPTSTQESRNTSLSWKKYSENDKWEATITAGYTYDKLHFVDTARRTYFWDQNFVTQINGGETANYSNGTAPVLTTRTWFSRESFSYSLTRQHTLNLTALLTNDELSIRNEAVPQDVQEGLLPPQKLLKNYTGLALASKLLDGKLTNTVSAKHFYLRSSGVTFRNNIVGPREKNDFSIFGYGDVIQYHIHPQITLNLGYEFTVRQPDREEIFGNYLTIAPNPNLRPEKSHNVNFGAEFRSATNRFNAGTTVFYRNTSDRMFLNAVTFGLAQYENLLGTRALGAELHTDYLIMKGLKASVNATYQDITLQETNPQTNIPDRFIGARVPNTPYLFGNGQLTYSSKIEKLGDGRITFGYDFNYVHEFFLSWAEDGRKETKDIIPTQALHSVNLSWVAPKDRWSIGVECRNLTDARAFDNFSVQRPGRSYFVKTRLFLAN
ncbi:MAG: TonB-dependent receptor [Bacteroidota bacterium]